MALRTSLPVQPHLYIGDATGVPLDYGMVYFGEPNKDPEFYPIDIYYDESMTVAAAQPVRTKGGFMNAFGDMVEVYADEQTYSVKVVDAYGYKVFYKPEMSKTSTGTSVSTKQPFANAVVRTQDEKNAETVSVEDFGASEYNTDNTNALNNAINHAKGAHKRLYWPNTYPASGNIAGIHEVDHYGPGGISKGGDVFYIDPNENQTNNLYCSPIGSTNNDGLTVSNPTTLNSAALALMNYGSHLNGKWIINLADGTYPVLTASSRLSNLSSSKFITFKGSDVGGHPNVPLAVINGSGGNSTLFDVRGWGLRVELQDIKFTNSNGGAFSATEGVTAQVVNVHQEDCRNGITWGSHATMYVSGGIHKWTSGFDGYALLRGVFTSKHNIGYRLDEQNNTATRDIEYEGAQLIGNTKGTGILLQEGVTGHMRGVVVDGFSVGSSIISNSRAHIEYCDFKNNSIAVDVYAGCDIFDNNNKWRPRGYDSNSLTIRHRGGVSIPDTLHPVVQMVGFVDTKSKTITSTSYTNVATPYTWSGVAKTAGMTMKLVAHGSITGTTASKNFRVVVSGRFICSLTMPPAAEGAFYLEMGFIKTNDDDLLPFGFANCASVSGNSAGIAEAVIQSSAVTAIISDGITKEIELQASVTDVADSIKFNFVQCYRSG